MKKSKKLERYYSLPLLPDRAVRLTQQTNLRELD